MVYNWESNFHTIKWFPFYSFIQRKDSLYLGHKHTYFGGWSSPSADVTEWAIFWLLATLLLKLLSLALRLEKTERLHGLKLNTWSHCHTWGLWGATVANMLLRLLVLNCYKLLRNTIYCQWELLIPAHGGIQGWIYYKIQYSQVLLKVNGMNQTLPLGVLIGLVCGLDLHRLVSSSSSSD